MTKDEHDKLQKMMELARSRAGEYAKTRDKLMKEYPNILVPECVNDIFLIHQRHAEMDAVAYILKCILERLPVTEET